MGDDKKMKSLSDLSITLTPDEAKALLEGWEIEETVPTKAFGADAMEQAENALATAKRKIRDGLKKRDIDAN